jgi:chromosome segregation ATPase
MSYIDVLEARIAELEAEIAEHKHARQSNEVQIAGLQANQGLHLARIAELEAEVERVEEQRAEDRRGYDA